MAINLASTLGFIILFIEVNRKVNRKWSTNTYQQSLGKNQQKIHTYPLVIPVFLALAEICWTYFSNE